MSDIKQQVSQSIKAYWLENYSDFNSDEITEQIHVLYEQHFIDKYCQAVEASSVNTDYSDIAIHAIREAPSG